MTGKLLAHNPEILDRMPEFQQNFVKLVQKARIMNEGKVAKLHNLWWTLQMNFTQGQSNNTSLSALTGEKKCSYTAGL